MSNRVSRRQAAKWSEPQQQQPPPPQQPQQPAYQQPAYQQPAYQQPAYQAPVAQAPVAQSPPPTSATDRVAALKDLADLQAAGILTPEEFALEKARILAS